MKGKTLDWFLENNENFEFLLGATLLFDQDSEYSKFSGVVTAALLDYEDLEKQISIFCMATQDGLITFKYGREDLRKMLTNCIKFTSATGLELCFAK